MSQKRKVEVFTAGCACCDEAVALVRSLACPSCEITMHDMKQETVARRARQLGIQRVPSVVIDGKLVECCTGGIEEQSLRSAGLASRCK